MELSSENMMTSANLATCLGPTLLTPAETDEIGMAACDVFAQNLIVEYILDNWAAIRPRVEELLPVEDELKPASPHPLQSISAASSTAVGGMSRRGPGPIRAGSAHTLRTSCVAIDSDTPRLTELTRCGVPEYS